ncbi:eCIS core domain-containing protein [Streptomyces sp. NPDC004673]
MQAHANDRATTRTDAAAARTPAVRASRPPRGLLALQRTAGNAVVAQMMRRSGHAEEEEHQHGADCGHDRPTVQRSAVHDVLRSGGQPLDASSRADMEGRFGADFSDVRVHTGAAAEKSAAEVGAIAYTSGSHIVAGAGGIDRHTLAHELTHVIQQRSGPVAGTDRGDGLRVSDPADRFEREAETNARRVLSGPAPTASASGAPDSAQATPSRAEPGNVQRVEYPDRIDDENDRLFDQLGGSLGDYRTHWAKWKQQDFKWVMQNPDLNDVIEALNSYLGDPGTRDEAQLAADLRTDINSKLLTTSSETMQGARDAAGNAKNKLVLGRLGDTGRWADYQKTKPEGGDRLALDDRLGRRLNTGAWSVPVNYAFLDGGIAERAVFKVLTPLDSKIESMLIGGALDTANFWQEVEALGDSTLWDSSKTADEGGPQSMLGHELLQLLRAGYQFHGRESTFAQGARVVAVHPDKPAADPGDKTKPLTI